MQKLAEKRKKIRLRWNRKRESGKTTFSVLTRAVRATARRRRGLPGMGAVREYVRPMKRIINFFKNLWQRLTGSMRSGKSQS